MKNRTSTIETFEELTEKILVRGDFLSTYIRGHLMIEFLYRKILNVSPECNSTRIDRMQHSKLIHAMYAKEHIDDNEKKVFLEINRIRNEFAHHGLTYFPSVAEMKSLFRNTKDTFDELFEGFSRGLEKLDQIEFIEISEIEILIDFFMEILYHLKCRYDNTFEEYNFCSLREGWKQRAAHGGQPDGAREYP